jgi:hypothetical protein
MLEPLEPGALVIARELARGALRKGPEPRPVAALDLQPLAPSLQHLRGELLDRLEHLEARLGGVLDRPDQALIRERQQAVDDTWQVAEELGLIKLLGAVAVTDAITAGFDL